MAIRIDSLQRAARRGAVVVENYSAAIAKRKSTAFLCHSHLDKELAKGLQIELAQAGWDVFIDWELGVMIERPTRATVERIQKEIQERDWLIYLATPNSERSRWCPWEIGFADGRKSSDSVVIVATEDSNGTYGAEYLNLYKQIDVDPVLGYVMRKVGLPAKQVRSARTMPSPSL
ncbi:toll/interleukin-1 receptor domain-containing protein [Variovorax sp. efr-133-TYG-130]|uniref:toll/interleukin-1 receptor domain-containing protein n=1 Tax=Variovorax sp. efr-133-TYG-130 TaxID=3040327 RepID=UPI0025568515|nr:toll/interleukin-1 receptor domain-containing protein [Variovorax sp. efr-133-TYG-130]